MESSQQSTQDAQKKQSRVRYDHLRAIEKQMQEVHLASKVTEVGPIAAGSDLSVEDQKKGKFFTTFPYPYMNGYLHLGHAFSLSKNEFSTRYQKQQGKNVLFPFSFHCTGMPMHAAAIRLRRELESGRLTSVADEKGVRKLTQHEILTQIGISAEEIPKFVEANHWLRFFPPEAQKDLKDFGLYTDWRRSFITTELNPYYDSFIRWQFNSLKAKDKIRFGKRYTVYSVLDGQACADHDRSFGEQVGPQEYTIIKIKCLELPESMKEKFAGKNVYLTAATLRPETMYGQTNCFVLPEGEYGVFEMKNDEYFVCSERAAKNLAYQEITKEWGQYPNLHTVKGTELIGLPLKAPHSQYDVVYALPMMTILMNKGTGIVTSVPSDSPDDFAALRDLQNKEPLRKKYGLRDDQVMPFAPVPIINIPGFGDLSAVKVVEELGITSQNDKIKLTEAKDKVYLKGFTEGVMLVGAYAGQAVKNIKPLVKKQMIDDGFACNYYEPESSVVSRTGDDCIVALVDQWFLTYGEESWKNTVKDHVKSDNFQAYNPKTQHEFEETLDWLGEWACSRNTGLGTYVPWDKQFLIESLSDSTIYMAYYTISHHLQGGVMDGSVVGPSGIKAEEMTDEVWNYIFKKAEYPAGCSISEETLKPLQNEFNYWYPLDLRCSGKDLIRNHLTMSLYNHAAIWEDQSMMPKSMFCNGWVNVNGEKMSKSAGNFFTVRDCIDKYGVDATRIALADAGDGLDDANFDEFVANAAILRLFVFEKWVSDEIKKHIPEGKVDFSNIPEYDLWDRIVENELNLSIQITTKMYEEMKYKQVIKFGFFEIQALKEDYLIAKGDKKINPFVILKFIETQLIMLNPVTPHFAEYCYLSHLRPVYEKSGHPHAENLIQQGWPQMTRPHDKIESRIYQYMRSIKSNVRLAMEKAKSGGKKGGKAKPKATAVPEEEKNPIENCAVFIATAYPEWQQKTLTIIASFPFDEKNKIQGNYINAIKEAITDKKMQGNALKFGAFTAKEAEVVGKDAALELQMPFDEIQVIDSNRDFIFENMPGVKNITVQLSSADSVEAAKLTKEGALPGKPAFFFY